MPWDSLGELSTRPLDETAAIEQWGEDLLQARMPNGFLVDVGWYGQRGCHVLLVEEENADAWDNPLLDLAVQDLEQLEAAVEQAVQFTR